MQQNTLEWLPIFLLLLWLFAFSVSDWIAAVLGLLWIVGRLLYIRDYSEAAEKRHKGFFLQMGASGVLFVGALAGIIWRMTHGG